MKTSVPRKVAELPLHIGDEAIHHVLGVQWAGNLAQAVDEYASLIEGELSVSKGETVVILAMDQHGWAKCVTMDGARSGYVPLAWLQMQPVEDPTGDLTLLPAADPGSAPQ